MQQQASPIVVNTEHLQASASDATVSVPAPLFLLSPPRSFSSVISSMLGQHPELHALPELQIFRHSSVGEVLEHNISRPYMPPRLATPGLLRALAQLREGRQCEKSCLRAWQWLLEHWSMDPFTLFDHIRSLSAPAVTIEKTPANTIHAKTLMRIIQRYPAAHFLHLTRSVNGNQSSLHDFLFNNPNRGAKERLKESRFRRSTLWLAHPALIWYASHRNVLELRTLISPKRYLQVKGEDLLQHPRRILRSIAQWLGIRTDDQAINCMLRPHESPYSYVGPHCCAGGNDYKFMRQPVFRPRRESLSMTTFSQEPSSQAVRFNAAEFFQYYRKLTFQDSEISLIQDWNDTMADEITRMQRVLGYG